MNEIYLDNYHLHSLTTDGLPTKVDRGLDGLASPEQRVDSYNNPGADGQTVANILHGGRLIVLEGRVRSFGANDAEKVINYRANRAAFHQLIGANRNASGQMIPRVLRFVDATGAEYRISVVVQALKNPDELPTTSGFQLQLLATDYLIYSETESSVSLTLPISGGVAFPFSFPLGFGSSSGGSATATNHGTTATAPVITFTGPMTNPRLSNDTTGQVMALDITLGAGDEITVDMKRRTIVQGGSTNRMNAKSGESSFWSLAPGENLLRLSATSYDSGSVSVTYRDAFLGL